MNTIIPLKRPQSYIDFLYREANRDDAKNGKEYVPPPCPKMKFKKEKWGKVAMYAFKRELLSLTRP